MNKAVFSDQFDYQDIEYVLVCDGNYYESRGRGGIGWVLIDQEMGKSIFEGCKVVNSNSTTESEYKSIFYGLKDTLKKDKDNVLIKTDLNGIVSDIEQDRDTDMKNDLESLLCEFDSWCIKIVDRESTKRAHYLADYVMNK